MKYTPSFEQVAQAAAPKYSYKTMMQILRAGRVTEENRVIEKRQKRICMAWLHHITLL